MANSTPSGKVRFKHAFLSTKKADTSRKLSQLSLSFRGGSRRQKCLAGLGAPFLGFGHHVPTFAVPMCCLPSVNRAGTGHAVGSVERLKGFQIASMAMWLLAPLLVELGSITSMQPLRRAGDWEPASEAEDAREEPRETLLLELWDLPVLPLLALR